MAIDMVKIRARITIGGLVVVTPYILSFNVNLVRGQVGTFDASVKVPYDESGDITGNNIVIEAGEGSPKNTIFTGTVKEAKISPVFQDPLYVLINMRGDDLLSELVNKKFTRRCKATQTSWVSIDGVVRKGLRSGKFKAVTDQLIDTMETYFSDNAETIKYRSTANADKMASVAKNPPKGSNYTNMNPIGRAASNTNNTEGES
jgi:hypothetical protein